MPASAKIQCSHSKGRSPSLTVRSGGSVPFGSAPCMPRSTLASVSAPSRSPKVISLHQPVNRRLVRAAAATTQTVDDAVDVAYSGESFYEIFGVSPDADGREIKRAYYNLMKECHPDQSGDDESTEFCIMLNDIYETLMDPARRAIYDDLAGFSDVSTNPFLDVAHERDLVFVDELTCIGCRNCNNVCPKTFTMEEDWGRARVMRQRMDTDEKLQEAIDTCPVSCIHWVSAPQLSLLEASMARMERIAVWSLMSGGGANRDVFTDASLAWEKRFAAMRARRASAAAAQAMAAAAAPQDAQGSSFWDSIRSSVGGMEGASGSRFYQQAQAASAKQKSSGPEEDAGSYGSAAAMGGKDAKNIASLAARAARASRSWRVYQELERSLRGNLSISALSSASSMDEDDLYQA